MSLLDSPELWSALLGAVVGGALTWLGTWQQGRAHLAAQRRILLRKARADLETSLRSFAYMVNDDDLRRHADGSLMSQPTIHPLTLILSTEVDLEPLPRSVLDTMFAISERIAAINRIKAPDEGTPEDVRATAFATTHTAMCELRDEILELGDQITERLHEPASASLARVFDQGDRRTRRLFRR